MSKDKISDYSETPGNNTDIGGINIAEGMLPSDVNNAIREQMAQLKKFQSGTSSESVTFVTANLTTANVGQVNVDNLRLDGNTFSSTNSNGNIAITPNGTGEVDISKVDIDGGAIDGTIIGGASAAAITGTTITANTSVSTDTISEKTSAAGVTVDGVLLKDSEVTTDVIKEKTSAAGVTVDGVILKDSQVSTDQINEKTSAAGVTVDGVLLKDSEVTTDVIKEKTSATGVTVDGVLLKDSGVVTGAGTVSAPVYSTTGDLNTGIYFPAADTIGFVCGGTEDFRVDGTGQLWNTVESEVGTDYTTLYKGYMCRAWVNFNGTGTVAIRASGNVSSITDNGTGDYTVNFTTAMPDVNYATTVGFNNQVSNDGANLKFVSSTSGSVTVQKFENNASVDCTHVFVAIFR